MITAQPLKRSALALAIATTLALAACGGGSGGGDNGDDNTAGNSTDYATTNGVAAKGIIQHGLVEVWEMDDGGNPVRQVGEAETDDNGRYEAAIDRDKYTGGPLLIKVKAKPGAKMICDVHGAGCEYGKPVALDGDFEMEAVAPPPAKGEKVKVQVTPLTHMAAQRVRKSGKVDKAAVKAAISEISELVGVDILAVEPVDITKGGGEGADDKARAYAAFVAGAGKLAMQAGGLKQGLEKLAKSFEDGKFDADDDIKIGDLLEAVEDEAGRSGVQSTHLRNRVELIRAVVTANGGSFDPEPGEDAGSDAGDVAKARALVQKVRAWVANIRGLQNPAEAFGTDMDLAGQVLDQNAGQLVDGFANGLAQVGDFLAAKLAAGQDVFQTFTVPITQNGTPVGSVDVTGQEVSDGVQFTVGNDPENPLPVNVALTLFTSLSKADLQALRAGTGAITLNGLRFKVNGSIEDDNVRLEVKDLTARTDLKQQATFDVTAPGEVAPQGGTRPEPAGAALEGQVILTAKGKGSFSGELNLGFVPLVPGAIGGVPEQGPPLTPGGLRLAGRFADAAGARSLQASVRVDLQNPGQFNLLALLGRRDGGSAGAPSGFGGGGMPGGGDGAGGDGGPDFENGDQFVKGTVTLTTEVDLGGDNGAATLTVTAERIGRRKARFVATVARNGQSLTGEAIVEEHGGLGEVTFTDTAGDKLTVKAVKDAVEGAVLVNGRPVGIISTPGGDGVPVIRYSDGQIETLI